MRAPDNCLVSGLSFRWAGLEGSVRLSQVSCRHGAENEEAKVWC